LALLGMAAWTLLKALLVTLVRPFRLPLLNVIDVTTSWMDFANYVLVLLSHWREEYVQVGSNSGPPARAAGGDL
jgi:hypothetical protein